MSAPSRRELLQRSGILAVIAPRAGTVSEDFDIHVCLTDEGEVYAFCGHVDLGTGIRTALAQIVAEELDVAFATVTMILGDTADTPNQGPTIASETIQVTAIPLRIASAQARHHLISLASESLGRPIDELATRNGAVSSRSDASVNLSFASLLQNRRIHLPLAKKADLKPVSEHRIVGKAVARVDIPEKVAGLFVYVHDVRLPGMLHGRVVRPPYAGIDGGDFVGRSLEAVDEASLAGIPGIVAVVVEGDFIGIVAEREEQAIEAMSALLVTWKPWAAGADLNDLDKALRAQPVQSRRLIDEGDVDAALAGASNRLDRTYVWPYQMHGSIGPSCAVADVRPEGITAWSGTQNPFLLRADISLLTAVPEAHIEIIRAEAAGCYGRNCADDVVADAVLLSRAVGRPVRVQLTREQEHLWEPKGAGQIMDVAGALGPGDSLLAYAFQTRYPSNAAPTLALLLTGRISPQPAVLEMGDRTAMPAYAYENLRVTVHDMAPLARASWLRGVSALPNVFAHESFIDELAVEAKADPVEFRLRHLKDPRAVELVKATAERAGWRPHVGPAVQKDGAEMLFGRGFAQARYMHGKWPGVGAAWSAWVADVAVNRSTGEISVTRVTVGQDTGMIINPAGVQHQIHGNVVQSTSRVLKEEVSFTQTMAVANKEWGSYPVLAFPDVPSIDVVLMDRQFEPPLGAGESASVPSAAAIVNAVYDATGVRFRELPLTPERVLAALGTKPAKLTTNSVKRRAMLGGFGALFAGLAGLTAVAMPIRSAIAPIPRPDPSVYSAATIDRGRILAALGACATCHTAPGGAALAGGLPLDTPFGQVMTTNITPDPDTGIGAWSFPAFERAMREGVHRDGRHLYPAFPYPSFTKTSDVDLEALYAYLMAQPAVSQLNKPSRLAFPFNLRPLMAGWNLMFNRRGAVAADPARTAEWNRGRYLVDGLGHCGACHTPRNALGAEAYRDLYLAGGTAEGWDAPALTRLSAAPIPWSEPEFFAYLRDGGSPHHGAAAGPMAPVIDALKAVPDADIRAMAIYLASLNTALPRGEAETTAASIVSASTASAHPALTTVARLFDGACAVCHEAGRGPPLINDGPALSLSTSLHATNPMNFLRVVIEGIDNSSHGAMPGFGQVLDDRQIADLARYARARFAPDKPAWSNVDQKVDELRKDTR